MISFATPKHHWNYFLAIEKDLEKLSRYIEFSKANLGTYSIELAHILLSASSEVDVIMKQLCVLIDSSKNPNNIKEYKEIILEKLPSLINEEISISRYGLYFKPWENWHKQSPNWWKSHNNVKHQRNDHFNEANLQNTINAVGGLLLTVVYYYQYSFSKDKGKNVDFKDVTRELEPETSFMKINADYYYHHLIV